VTTNPLLPARAQAPAAAGRQRAEPDLEVAGYGRRAPLDELSRFGFIHGERHGRDHSEFVQGRGSGPGRGVASTASAPNSTKRAHGQPPITARVARHGRRASVDRGRPPPEHRLMLRQPDNTMLFDYALNPAQIRLLYAQRNERPQ
jgi:hypothetical protein